MKSLPKPRVPAAVAWPRAGLLHQSVTESRGCRRAAALIPVGAFDFFDLDASDGARPSLTLVYVLFLRAGFGVVAVDSLAEENS